MIPAGIKPATFRFVAQHLNHCATAVPIYIITAGLEKVEAIPLHIWTDPEGSRRFRLPDFKTIGI